MSTAILKPQKRKVFPKKETRPCMDEFEQQESAELIQLALQDDTELVFTVYRKYKEPDVI